MKCVKTQDTVGHVSLPSTSQIIKDHKGDNTEKDMYK